SDSQYPRARHPLAPQGRQSRGTDPYGARASRQVGRPAAAGPLLWPRRPHRAASEARDDGQSSDDRGPARHQSPPVPGHSGEGGYRPKATGPSRKVIGQFFSTPTYQRGKKRDGQANLL